MATLDDSEKGLIEVESGFEDIKNKNQSKQNERLLSSHVWMSDYLEQYKKKVSNFRNSLDFVKKGHVGDFKSATQFDAVLKMSDEVSGILDDIIKTYKMQATLTDLKLKWYYTLPTLAEKIKSMRNRFNIIKGQITRKKFEYEEESWF